MVVRGHENVRSHEVDHSLREPTIEGQDWKVADGNRHFTRAEKARLLSQVENTVLCETADGDDVQPICDMMDRGGGTEVLLKLNYFRKCDRIPSLPTDVIVPRQVDHGLPLLLVVDRVEASSISLQLLSIGLAGLVGKVAEEYNCVDGISRHCPPLKDGYENENFIQFTGLKQF